MVLAVMVIFLSVRVYQVLNPEEGTQGRSFNLPGPDPDPENLPGPPPAVPGAPLTEDWSPIWRRSIFHWPRQRATSSTRGGGVSEIDLQLLRIQEVTDGVFRAQIRTTTTKWYSEGEAFEAFELISIDPDTECCVVFAEEIGRNVEICAND